MVYVILNRGTAGAKLDSFSTVEANIDHAKHHGILAFIWILVQLLAMAT